MPLLITPQVLGGGDGDDEFAGSPNRYIIRVAACSCYSPWSMANVMVPGDGDGAGAGALGRLRWARLGGMVGGWLMRRDDADAEVHACIR